MSKIEDGGPAFPGPLQENPRDGHLYGDAGMSLRDYYMAHAPEPPQWWRDAHVESVDNLGHAAEAMAQWAAVYADALIAERQP